MSTEAWNPASVGISEAGTEDMLRLINDEEQKVADIVRDCIPQIALLVEEGTKAVSSGHRIIYVGAGTSGRLAIADAAECPPTYGISPECFTAVISGGHEAVFRAAEGAEDSREAGAAAFYENNCVKEDFIIGISVSGQAPYVVAFMEEAKKAGCMVAALVNNEGSPMTKVADLVVVADTGAEVIKGSTRMKGGTSQKMILNMFSTAVCIKLGCTYKNYMVNMKPTNSKLKRRSVAMVQEITGVSPEEAVKMLDDSEWSVRHAVEGFFKNN